MSTNHMIAARLSLSLSLSLCLPLKAIINRKSLLPCTHISTMDNMDNQQEERDQPIDGQNLQDGPQLDIPLGAPPQEMQEVGEMMNGPLQGQSG